MLRWKQNFYEKTEQKDLNSNNNRFIVDTIECCRFYALNNGDTALGEEDAEMYIKMVANEVTLF